MATLPEPEIFPDVNTNGLFRIYVDTKTFTAAGGETIDQLTSTSSNDKFIKKISTKIRSSFISLLRSVSNSRCANLPQDLLEKLFDENGELYNQPDQYTKSVYGLLSSNNIVIDKFYNTTGEITTKQSNIACNIAYFTFKMQFKYKLLDYVIQVDIGHGLYTNTNEYTGSDVTVTGDLTVNKDLTICGVSTLDCVSSTGLATLNNLTVNGTSEFYNTITVGNAGCSYDVKIYGENNKYLEWDASASSLNLRGELVIGANNTGDTGTDNDDYNNVTIYGKTGQLDWVAATNTLDLNGTLNAQQDACILGDVTIGSGTNDSSLFVYGSSSSMSIDWNKSHTDKLVLKGALDIGTTTAGHFVKIHSNNCDKYIQWDPENCKLKINADCVVIGEECNGSTLKIWGTDNGKYIDWNSSDNKLQIVGHVDLHADHRLVLNGTYNGAVTCTWEGITGTFTNYGKTVLSETDISGPLECGTPAAGCNFIVHGAAGTGKIDWSKTTNTFEITGLLTVSGNTTLNGQLITDKDVTIKSATPGKTLAWNHVNNTFQVNGITNLCGAVTITSVDNSDVIVNSNITLQQHVTITDNVTIGANGTGYSFKAYGDANGDFIEWNNSKYTVTGTTVLDGNVTTQTGTLTINSDTTIDAAKTLTCNGSSTFNNTVDLTGALNTAAATVITCTGAAGSWTWNNANTPNKLNLLCDLTMTGKTMELTDSNFIIDSCNNNYYLKWLTQNNDLLINSNDIKITSNFELNDNTNANATDKTIKWNKINLECNAPIITNDSITINDDVNGNSITWSNTNPGTLDVESIFNLKSNINNALSINWDQTNLTCNAPVITNHDITINDDGNGNNITWTKANGTLVADAVVKLEKNGTDDYIEWNNATPKFTINSDLDIKKGNVNIYNSTGDSSKIIWTSAGDGKLEVKSEVDFSIGDVTLTGDNSTIKWTPTTDILTATDCCITLKNNAETNKITWDPNDDLCILSKVNVTGDVNIYGDVNTKYIKWDKTTHDLTLDVKDITCTADDVTLNSTTLVINSCITTRKDINIQDCIGCDRITWEDTTKLLNIATDTELNGTDPTCKIAWDYDTNALTSEAKKVILKGTQVVDAPNADNFTGQVEWDKTTNRLNVDGSLVKTPFITTADISHDTVLNLNNHNNFHLTLCGDITLSNPTNACAGQEGRIVINGANRTITLESDWYIEREFCTDDRQITLTGSINVLVYYVFDTNKILLRLEKDYINACPAPGC